MWKWEMGWGRGDERLWRIMTHETRHPMISLRSRRLVHPSTVDDAMPCPPRDLISSRALNNKQKLVLSRSDLEGSKVKIVNLKGRPNPELVKQKQKNKSVTVLYFLLRWMLEFRPLRGAREENEWAGYLYLDRSGMSRKPKQPGVGDKVSNDGQWCPILLLLAVCYHGIQS
jgi:hypothetical protein